MNTPTCSCDFNGVPEHDSTKCPWFIPEENEPPMSAETEELTPGEKNFGDLIGG